jgi:hypothetical protein
LSPVQHVSTRPPQRPGVSRPAITGHRPIAPIILHDIEYEQDYYDPVPELTLKQAANAMLDEKAALRIFQKGEWNQDGLHRYPITDNSNVVDLSEGSPEFSLHSEFYVYLPGMAIMLWNEDAPIFWEMRDQHLRDASVQTYFHSPPPYAITWKDLPLSMKNVRILSVSYRTEVEDWKDAEGYVMKRVIGLKPVNVRFHTPPPNYGYVAARRFNAFIEIAIRKKGIKAKWLDGLSFKVGEGGILGLHDSEDFNYVAEMTDFEGQTDAVEMLLVPGLAEKVFDTSKAIPDITAKEQRINELEMMFESYLQAHPDAPSNYMTISIVLGVSDEYYALLEEFGGL